jgi:hypothetical protein
MSQRPIDKIFTIMTHVTLGVIFGAIIAEYANEIVKRPFTNLEVIGILSIYISIILVIYWLEKKANDRN